MIRQASRKDAIVKWGKGLFVGLVGILIASCLISCHSSYVVLGGRFQEHHFNFQLFQNAASVSDEFRLGQYLKKQQSLDLSQHEMGVIPADLNGDGRMDFITLPQGNCDATNGFCQPIVYLNKGYGHFSPIKRCLQDSVDPKAPVRILETMANGLNKIQFGADEALDQYDGFVYCPYHIPFLKMQAQRFYFISEDSAQNLPVLKPYFQLAIKALKKTLPPQCAKVVSTQNTFILLADLNSDGVEDMLVRFLPEKHLSCSQLTQKGITFALLLNPHGEYQQIQVDFAPNTSYPVYLLKPKQHGLNNLIMEDYTVLRFNGKVYQ